MSGVASSEIPAGLPPGPELPRSRQTARWMARPVGFLQALQRSHGDVFTLHLLQERPWVVLSDPELVRQVLTAPADVLHGSASKRILEPVLGSGSVILAEGEEHMRRRRLLLPAFHGARIAGYEATMRAVAAEAIDRWPSGVAEPAAPRMRAIALEVILRTVFGAAEERRLEPLREALGGLLEYLSLSARAAIVALGDRARLRDSRFAELREAIERTDAAIFAELARRRAGQGPGPGDDVMTLLLAARYDDGAPMSDGDLRDQLVTLVVAGHDTTATSLSWALERLARNPEALERTAAEAAQGGGPYTEAVIQETLRIRPPFMTVPRLVRRPFRLGDLLLPAGVEVAPAIPLVHRRADVYPDPEAFRPERFLERPPATYTWIPFGGGVRRCIGAGFSMLQMRVVLSTLLARATVRAETEEPEPAARQGLVLAPARDARIVLERR